MKKDNKLIKHRTGGCLLGIMAACCLCWGCSDDGDFTLQSGSGGSILPLNYNIVTPYAQDETKAVASSAEENRINDLYLFFFYPENSSQGASYDNRYAGYSKVDLNSSGSSGNTEVVLPDAAMDIADSWQIICVANFEKYADIGSYSNPDAWVKAVLGSGTPATSATVDEAKELLSAIASSPSGIAYPLLMNGFTVKSYGDSEGIDVGLKRNVARIDVSAVSSSDFSLETAEVYNARAGSLICDGIGKGGFVNYTSNIAPAEDGKIAEALYVFPNAGNTPAFGDGNTTCLIVGGRYGEDDYTTYYRIDVKPDKSVQQLTRNHLYEIEITGISERGSLSKTDAYAQGESLVYYTINDWTDDNLSKYVFDADGNGLAVSCANIDFSEHGGQSVEITVSRIYSSTNPEHGEWEVSGVSDSENFAAVKNGDKVLVSALNDNSTFMDRPAEFSVSWDDISVPVSLRQRGTNSLVSPVKIVPGNLSFTAENETKEIIVEIGEALTGITLDNIKYEYIPGSASGGWLSIASGSSNSQGNAESGKFYFDITAAALPEGETSRYGRMKFVVETDSRVVTAFVEVAQDRESIVDDYVRQLSIDMYELSSEEEGGEEDIYVWRSSADNFANTFRGLPAGRVGNRVINFAGIGYKALKYKLKIRSSMAWEFDSEDPAILALLDFSTMSGDGDMETTTEVTILPSGDFPANAGWNGSFRLKYENGDFTEFHAYQQGAFSSIKSADFTDGHQIYYYGFITIDGRTWLDRDIGSESTGFYSKLSEYDNKNIVDEKAQGFVVNYDEAQKNCPHGFRLPVADLTDLSKELGKVYAGAKFSYTAGIEKDGVNYPNVWYYTYGETSSDIWIISYTASYVNSALTTYPYLAYYRGYGGERVRFASKNSAYYQYDNEIRVSDSLKESKVAIRCIKDDVAP